VPVLITVVGLGQLHRGKLCHEFPGVGKQGSVLRLFEGLSLGKGNKQFRFWTTLGTLRSHAERCFFWERHLWE
jgi:hypothetical protein